MGGPYPRCLGVPIPTYVAQIRLLSHLFVILSNPFCSSPVSPQSTRSLCGMSLSIVVSEDSIADRGPFFFLTGFTFLFYVDPTS